MKFPMAKMAPIHYDTLYGIFTIPIKKYGPKGNLRR